MRIVPELFIRVAKYAVFPFLAIGVIAGASPANAGDSTLAHMNVGSTMISWEPLAQDEGLTLTVTGPDSFHLQNSFLPNELPVFSLFDENGQDRPDGFYRYALTSASARDVSFFDIADEDRGLIETGPAVSSEQPGFFTIANGAFLDPEQSTAEALVGAGELNYTRTRNPGGTHRDTVNLDDMIIDGSLCVGIDCVNGESFGFDTVRLKENNLRINFTDTSSTSTFPTRDWAIQINSSANGGGDYFNILDVDAVSSPFRIEGGSSNYALYVRSNANIGLGTATPALKLHLKKGDTPSVRLEQDGASGWPAQTWDVAANELNFFVRDATTGSNLPFRIQSGAPANSLTVLASGNVGLGTWSPESDFEIERTGSNPTITVDRTDGAKAALTGAAGSADVGSASNHPVRLLTNGVVHMTLNTDSSLTMASGATCTVGGAWVNSSSRAHKEQIRPLSTEVAFAALDNLEPVRFRYKAEQGEEYLGFIAEDVPALVATADRDGLSSMDIVALLTRVVKEQRAVIDRQQADMDQIEEKLSRLEKLVLKGSEL